MSKEITNVEDIKIDAFGAFDSFDVADVEILEAADGTALPDMGASSGWIGTSSASSSTCSAC